MASGTGNRRVICVYCGSRPGKSPAHLEAARALAHVFAAHNIQLVYGGGTIGLMGELASTLVKLSGPDSVFGVIPDTLIKFEQSTTQGSGKMTREEHEAVFGRTTIVPDMHSRKQLMARKVVDGGPGSGFVALSGGYGTLEELMEMTTWNQLGIHGVGVCVFNVSGFYDGLLSWIRNAVHEDFVSQDNQGIIVEARSAEEVVLVLAQYTLATGRYNLDWKKN